MKVLSNLVFLTGLSVLVGCSDSDDAAKVIPPAEKVSVYDAAKSAGNFTTLVAALDATGLDDTLDDTDSTFTVFAPTDEAFALLGTDAINSLLADTDTLSSILTYHVLPQEVLAETALSLAGNSATTVNGSDIALSLSGEKLLINTSTVIQTDIKTDNGVIHVIDAVLSPPNKTASSLNIAEVATQAGTFSTLLKAVDTAGLTSVLTGSEPLTVFAPTDAAFNALGTSTINTLLANPSTLSEILKQHIISGKVDSVTAMTLNGKSASTLRGNQLEVSIDAESNMLKLAGVSITQTDIMASNGVIHVLDAVIVSDVTVPESKGLITEVAAQNGSFNTLVSLLGSTGLDQVLGDPTQKFTVFAPTDQAFSALGQATLDSLAADTESLKNILLYHVLSGQSVMSDAALSIASSAENKITMANDAMAALSTQNSQLLINDAVVRTANVEADNGVIHVLDKVIMPPLMKTSTTKTIAEIATETANLSTLVSALQAADLVSTMADTNNMLTVFAPTNRAFEKVPAASLNALLADTSALSTVLKTHVLGLEAPAPTAYQLNGKQVDSLSGNKVNINIVDFAGSANTSTDAIAYDSNEMRLVSGQAQSKKGFTLYVFDSDLTNANSQCNDACASAWPPVIVTSEQIKNIPGLGTSMRDDGQMQANYLGRPLYYYANDTQAGDAKGQGVNNVWWQVSLPRSGLQVSGSNVTQTDIYAANGVIHLIDTVILD